VDRVSATGDIAVVKASLRRQLITLAVDTSPSRGEADLLTIVVGARSGVQAVERDPLCARIWVFGNGTVEPEALCDALASWGYGAYVLENQLTVAA
jgi:hypothetical protein